MKEQNSHEKLHGFAKRRSAKYDQNYKNVLLTSTSQIHEVKQRDVVLIGQNLFKTMSS
jgi:hypothetical protein